jgi:hypothetical protein
MTEMGGNGFFLGLVTGSTPQNVRVINLEDTWYADLDKIKGSCKSPEFLLRHPKGGGMDLSQVHPDHRSQYIKDFVQKYHEERRV